MKARLAILSILTLAAACTGGKKDEFAALYEGLPFDMPRVELPSIPDREAVLTDFGGVGDGVTMNTEAFREAIGALASLGGGRLVVPAGIWRTGPVELLSHIELYVDKDAVIVFDPDQDLYPIIDTNFEGLDVRRCVSPLNATKAHDIAVTGGGIIDGSGEYWREVKRRKVSDDLWKAILKRGGVVAEDGSNWFPDEGYQKARATAGSLNYPDPSLDEQEIKTFLRPVMVSFRECERVLLQDCTFQNSPCWNIHPLWCKDVIIKDITVRNPHYSANGDGIDIDGCENVIVTGSSFDVGDDAICIKSGKDADGRAHAKTCRNLIIADCTVYHGHGGFVVGSEMSGGVENIRVTRCRFIGTDVGLRFKSARGRGGVVKDIWCDHIYMKDIVTYGIVFNLYYAGVAATEMSKDGTGDIQPVDETTPEFRDFRFSDITCAGADQAVFVNGIPEMPVRNLAVTNSTFTANKGVETHFAENVTFDNVFVNGEKI